MYRDRWLSILITVTLLIIAKIFKYHKYLLINSWYNKVYYVHIIEHICPEGHNERVSEKYSVCLIKWETERKITTMQHILYG